jgi:hypothetical protein
MARVPLPKRVQGSRDLNDAQDAIGETLRRVVYHEQLTGQDIQSVSVPSTGVAIAHGLGRTPIGWNMIDKTDAGDVYRTAWDSKTITLRTASGTVRGSLFVW